ncbi:MULTISPECIES: CpaD family pilus assembly protein [unclassified Xanthobacter]|uniref:CpaD family pilus assembly protein n=1 Tax=unclassified Xanthobacter TaxID=2623496 RepID=UPI001F20140E|nr:MULTISPECIES: CpaD family pilus assembly protein [unclassified Xanthobacter]
MTTQTQTISASCRWLLLAALGLMAAGCTTDGWWTEPTYPLDYRQRHPIELVDSEQVLEVFPRTGHGIDPRQAADIRAFGQSYLRSGKSPLVIVAPTELLPGQKRELVNPFVRRTLEEVRSALGAAGVRRVAIEVRYARGNGGETPLRLSYSSMAARVAHECGKWPFDLAAGAGLEGAQNEPYWNLGCAYQANLATQVADPLDLVRPRQETPGDAARRVGDIQAIREGKDPSTSYAKASSYSSSVVSGNAN